MWCDDGPFFFEELQDLQQVGGRKLREGAIYATFAYSMLTTVASNMKKKKDNRKGCSFSGYIRIFIPNICEYWSDHLGVYL